jgi:FtsP/CotA-like multicopper oxidase with cupredoxin domain
MTAAACLVLGTSAISTAQPTFQPPDWDAQLKLREANDINPDPRIVEVNLTARIAKVEIRPGELVELWTYDAMLPGPLIRARVGDRLIVHFLNQLPAPTTIHWHGQRVPLDMDGVPGVAQTEVSPGQSFTYDFVLRDAGLFWYHPHVMSAAQVGFGLYGALLVEDPNDGVGVADELVLVLSDLATGGDGRLEAPDSGGPAGMVFGREGNRVLVNGRWHGKLKVRDGAPERWRIVNAAKSRYFQLDLGGQLFTQIGGDGGLQEYSRQLTELVLAPGERADVIVTPRATPGEELVLRSFPFNRGYGSVEYRDVEELLTIDFDSLPVYNGTPPPKVTRDVSPIATKGATDESIHLTLAVRGDGSSEYGIDRVPFAKDRPIMAKLGETQIWTITNETKWSHPFHLHGFFFQVLGEDGNPVRPLAWKDTVDVPFEQTVRIAVRFDERPGSWMYHCHILDHADGGLMGMVDVGIDANHPRGAPDIHMHP